MSSSEHKIGDMLDKFKIVKDLGHGGMGAVYIIRMQDRELPVLSKQAKGES